MHQSDAEEIWWQGFTAEEKASAMQSSHYITLRSEVYHLTLRQVPRPLLRSLASSNAGDCSAQVRLSIPSTPLGLIMPVQPGWRRRQYCRHSYRPSH